MLPVIFSDIFQLELENYFTISGVSRIVIRYYRVFISNDIEAKKTDLFVWFAKIII